MKTIENKTNSAVSTRGFVTTALVLLILALVITMIAIIAHIKDLKVSDKTIEPSPSEAITTIKAKILTTPMVAGASYTTNKVYYKDTSTLAFFARAEKDSPLQNSLPDDSSLLCYSKGHYPLTDYIIAASLVEYARITEIIIELKGCLVDEGCYKGMFKLHSVSAFNYCFDVREK